MSGRSTQNIYIWCRKMLKYMFDEISEEQKRPSFNEISEEQKNSNAIS